MVLNEDGEQISTGNRYSSKYLFGNLLKCGNCGASYYRRTERGKIVWRCGTRMEKGKEVCGHSPTLQDDEIKSFLGETVCGNSYNEAIIKDKVKRIDVYEKQIIICVSGTEQYFICEQ
ncbi:zinc ribbon domain-containing protein [Lacrimispora indolis]|uniref:zinc ribbon domain-containing protein n=1 Tax=Lacrimispora indolis TaxID=69825 RepID=UPI002E8E1F9F|nr:zinc ribbon domain-containing protein [Lacrimispora indolis]